VLEGLAVRLGVVLGVFVALGAMVDRKTAVRVDVGLPVRFRGGVTRSPLQDETSAYIAMSDTMVRIYRDCRIKVISQFVAQ
jgi:hypothetical protein